MALRPGGTELTLIAAEKAALHAKSLVLDIGCGTGETLSFLSSRYGCRLYGTDLSESAVLTAKQRVPEADLRCADASSLPFPDGMFDACFSECVLSLLPHPEDALREAVRVLKPDGVLVVSTLSRTNGDELLKDGAVSVPHLTDALQTLGLTVLLSEDHTDALVRMAADMIFQSGSVEAYLREAEQAAGCRVFPCDTVIKNLGYHLLVARR